LSFPAGASSRKLRLLIAERRPGQTPSLVTVRAIDLDSTHLTYDLFFSLTVTSLADAIILRFVPPVDGSGDYAGVTAAVIVKPYRYLDTVLQSVVVNVCNDSINGGYRFGFNGKPHDDEFAGRGNFQDYGFRMYDPRIARFVSVDPLTKDYPWYTPYQFAGNTPITCIDLDGLEPARPHVPGKPQYGYVSANDMQLPQKTPYLAPHTGEVSRWVLFQEGAETFTFGVLTTFGSGTYISGTSGLGAAFGGTTAMTLGLGETAVGLTRMVDAFNVRTPDNELHSSGTMPGLLAYKAGNDDAPIIDALSAVAPSYITVGIGPGILKDVRSAAIQVQKGKVGQALVSTANAVDGARDVKALLDSGPRNKQTKSSNTPSISSSLEGVPKKPYEK